MYLLRHIFILFIVLFGKIFAPGKDSQTKDVCDGVLYHGMCYWTEPPPGGKHPVNCSGGELAWVSDNQTWQFITTNLDTELRTYSRLNLGIYSTPITETQINTNEWFTLYGKRMNWTDPNLKAESNNCVVLGKDMLQDENCDNGIMSLCQSSNVSVCYNRTMIFNKCYWTIPKLEDSRSIYTNEKECVRLGGTLAVPESQNISDRLGLEFPDDKYYIGMVNRLWYDLYTGQHVQNHFWYKDVDNDECVVMKDINLIENWKTRSCSSSFSSYAGLCAKDIEKGEVCPEVNTTSNIDIYRCNRCYWLTSPVKSMESAKQLCENNGGYLTYGKNDEEQNFLSNYVDQAATNNVWVGITSTQRRWYNSQGEQSWFNWHDPYSQDTCMTFSSFDSFKWSISCSEPIIPGLTTSAPKKGPGGASTELSLTTGNLCMKEDSSVISTTLLTTVEKPTTTYSTTKALTTTETTTEAQTTSEPTTEAQTTPETTTEAQTASEPTTEAQTTQETTTEAQTTSEPTTEAQTTPETTTEAQTTSEPTTEAQTTPETTTEAKTASEPTTEAQITSEPTTEARRTSEHTTEAKTTPETTTEAQTTSEPTTEAKTTSEIHKSSAILPTTEAQLSPIPKTSPSDPTTFKPIGFTKPTLTKDEKCHKISMDPESKQSRSINCLCPCKRQKNQVHTLDEQTIEQFQEETRKKLILSRQSISAVTQKKISLPDKRVSSTTIGTTSVVTIMGVLLTLVVADLFNIFLEIKRRMRYFSNQS